MSNGKSKADETKNKPKPPAPLPSKGTTVAAPAPPAKLPPLFRPIDWLAFALTTLLVFTGYFLTIAPDLTLEDSGELAVGSFYAGIPHPPGYPMWSIWTYFFCHIFTVGNIAYRVAVSSAVAGSLACGILALIVSRGSSMMIEGIESLKGIERRWENVICVVSGFVAGMLFGYNGYMWSQSVIVEVYPFSVLSLMGVLACMLRWIYAPHQRRYVMFAFFLFGICVTNHQTLLLAAMGIEVAIAAGQPKFGRDLFLGNAILYVVGLVAIQNHMIGALENNPPLLLIYHAIGVGSIAACIWLSILTKKIATEWMPVLIGLAVWLLGAGFYLYMPLAGMTCPPMQWGYPRTVEGFFHALSRGQYESTHPTDVVGDPLRLVKQVGFALIGGTADEFNWVYTLLAIVPFLFFFRMQKRERAWMIGLFAIYFCMSFILMMMLNPAPDRQSMQIQKVFFAASHVFIAIFIGYGLTLIAASMASDFPRFRKLALYGGGVAIVAALYTLVSSTETFFGESASIGGRNIYLAAISKMFAKDQYSLPLFAAVILLLLTLLYFASVWVSRSKAMLGVALGIFTLMPSYSILTQWFDNEQRHHLFGYWFGHDMFTPPFGIYPEMTRNAILYGGTDPGRFCPTYMIFDESFIPPSKKPLDPKFDRRDVYIITQNALADGTYLMYIRSHYNRSKQISLGLDTPFFQELLRSSKERELGYTTNARARLVAPLDTFFTHIGDRVERNRRAGSSLFKPDDFTDLPGFADKLQKHDAQDPLATWLFENLSKNTQQLLAGKAADSRLRSALAEDLNLLLEREVTDKAQVKTLQQEQDSLHPESSDKDAARKKAIDAEIETLTKHGSLFDTERFKNVPISDYLQKFIAENPQSHTRIRLNRELLEAAYPKQIAISQGGVYPDREMYIATPDDSAKCFQEYMADASKRMQHDMQFPNEPKQIRQGEDVHVIDNKVQVSGQVAVMAINGLLTKVMFDHNPDNEFFVEESFPLDWMYPHLTPFGVIMKINRQELPELTDDIIKKDHDFWSKYSERLTGNWITYDTSVKEICDFIEKVYLQHDYTRFTGDLKFIRDDNGQKAFSKLRSSIGGIYSWRAGMMAGIPTPQEYMPKSPAEQRRMIKEADFAFRQAFAYCPYSPEAVFRYVQLLASTQRFTDALLVAETASKLDPHNGSLSSLVDNLRGAPQLQSAERQPQRPSTEEMENAYRTHPDDFQNAFNLAASYAALQQTNRAVEILEQILNHPKVNVGAVLAAAQAYAQFANYPKLESTLDKLTKIAPETPEAWYDLSAVKILNGKSDDAIANLSHAIELSDKRLLTDSKSRNLRVEALKDTRFRPVAANPEFQKVTAGK